MPPMTPEEREAVTRLVQAEALAHELCLMGDEPCGEATCAVCIFRGVAARMDL
jgi:hypothetical protein